VRERRRPREDNALGSHRLERGSEKRAVKRNSPQPRLRRTAPSHSMQVSLASPGENLGAGKEPARIGRSRGRARSRKASEAMAADSSVARWDDRRARVLEYETVSECRSRSNASPAATPRHAILARRETRGLSSEELRPAGQAAEAAPNDGGARSLQDVSTKSRLAVSRPRA